MHEFQGVPTDSFDGRGNYTLGFKEQTLFPEIEYDKIDKVRGLEVIYHHHRRVGRGRPEPPGDARDAVRKSRSWLNMAKKSLILKSQRTPKYKVRKHNRCSICGRPRAYIRTFGICRICFRQLALDGPATGRPEVELVI